MANISWVVGVGSAATTLSLGSLRPDPGNRFFEVTPDYDPVGDFAVALTGEIHSFLFREDFTCGVVIRHLRPSQHTLMLELKQHLMNGGVVTLNTSDVDDTSYTDIQLAPGTKPEIKNDDDNRNLFSFSCMLMSDEPIVVNYDG